MIIVDSSVRVDYFDGSSTRESDYLDAVLGAVPIAVGDIILTEVLQGFREDRQYRTVRSLVEDLTLVEMVGRARAVRTADKFRALREKGVTIRRTSDMLAGSYCIDEAVPLLFSDKDFARARGAFGTTLCAARERPVEGWCRPRLSAATPVRPALQAFREPRTNRLAEHHPFPAPRDGDEQAEGSSDITR